ncbi:MAG: hypothetical protein ACYCZR_01030 [Burkholderiales bacterium]
MSRTVEMWFPVWTNEGAEKVEVSIPVMEDEPMKIHKEDEPPANATEGRSMTEGTLSDTPPSTIDHADERRRSVAMIISKAIAEKANECCHRSDGYEQEIVKYAYPLILLALQGETR